MNSHEYNLLSDLVYGIISNHDNAMTATCAFCGCDELVDDPEHDAECIYQRSLDWIS